MTNHRLLRTEHLRQTEGLLVRVQPGEHGGELNPPLGSLSWPRSSPQDRQGKCFAHFSMSFSKTWRRITLIRRALLRGESLMASSRRSLRPLMS